MGMIQAFADRVSLDDLIAHYEVEGFPKIGRFESEVSVNILEQIVDLKKMGTFHKKSLSSFISNGKCGHQQFPSYSCRNTLLLLRKAPIKSGSRIVREVQ